MGIYDRDYYRRDGPSFLGSFSIQGQTCKWLILINIAVYVIQLLTRVREPIGGGFFLWQAGPFTDALLLDPAKVMHGEVWRLLTYAFLHSPDVWQHIVFNMLFLWWFGSDVESLYGPREFLAFYLGAALAGGVIYQLVAMFQGDHGQCLGASGAVTAVMVLCALHFPNRMILLFFILPVPIWAFVIFQVAQDAFIFVGGVKTGTAVTVHLGGAAFGFLYYKMHWRLTGLMPSLRSWKARGVRPRLRVYHGAEDGSQPATVHVAAPPPAQPEVDEHFEAKLDAVLAKVARTGQASLNDTEKQILLRASEVYKKRRS
jgi:membrane associated rhomboid family serine protease